MKRGEETRARLVRLEQQEKARMEARAVVDGAAETVALSRARGAAIVEGKPARRRVCLQPYQRLSGLEWLARKGRLSAEQRRAGERYGVLYRRAAGDRAIVSSLALGPGGAAGPGLSLSEILAHGESVAQAQSALAMLRGRLGRQPDLVAACDAVCGEEQTPREAAGGDRDAVRVEAVLKVALDLLLA